MIRIALTAVISAVVFVHAYADNVKISSNKVSADWTVNGIYDETGRGHPACNAQSTTADNAATMVIVYDISDGESYIFLQSNNWKAKNPTIAAVHDNYPASFTFFDADGKIMKGANAFYYSSDYRYAQLTPNYIVMSYPQSDVIIHAVADTNRLRFEARDDGLAPIELPTHAGAALPVAWGDCINNFSERLNAYKNRGPNNVRQQTR